MTAEIPPVVGDWIAQGGAAGLLALAVWLILTGRIVPRRVLQDAEKDRDQWRQVALTAINQASTLLPAAQITSEITRAMYDATSVAVQQALVGAPRDETGDP